MPTNRILVGSFFSPSSWSEAQSCPSPSIGARTTFSIRMASPRPLSFCDSALPLRRCRRDRNLESLASFDGDLAAFTTAALLSVLLDSHSSMSRPCYRQPHIGQESPATSLELPDPSSTSNLLVVGLSPHLPFSAGGSARELAKPIRSRIPSKRNHHHRRRRHRHPQPLPPRRPFMQRPRRQQNRRRRIKRSQHRRHIQPSRPRRRNEQQIPRRIQQHRAHRPHHHHPRQPNLCLTRPRPAEPSPPPAASTPSDSPSSP